MTSDWAEPAKTKVTLAWAEPAGKKVTGDWTGTVETGDLET